MHGRPVSTERRLIAPVGVAMRQSTDLVAISDPRLASAIKFIRERACDGIGVQEVVRHAHMSRSVLQRRFRAALGRTVHDMIVDARLARVNQLLIETDMPIASIAERAGIRHVEYLSAAFKQRTGRTPSAFRRDGAKR